MLPAHYRSFFVLSLLSTASIANAVESTSSASAAAVESCDSTRHVDSEALPNDTERINTELATEIKTSNASLLSNNNKTVPHLGPGHHFGVEQALEIDNGAYGPQYAQYSSKIRKQDVLAKLGETHTYVKNTVTSKVHAYCYNYHEYCTMWALFGACEETEDYMYENCPAACQICEKAEGLGTDYGVEQELESLHDATFSTDRVLAKLEETDRYMADVIWSDPFYHKVRSLCYQDNAYCAMWASQGECQRSMQYMNHYCAPSCQTCDQLHPETQCPVDPIEMPDAWQPNDLNKVFESIVQDPSYDTKVYSRPEYLPGDNEATANYFVGPWILTIDDFITPEEAQHLIDWGYKMGYQQSFVMSADANGQLTKQYDLQDRTSFTVYCQDECENDPVVEDIFERMENMTGIPSENSEVLQLLKYEQNQFYKMHSDSRQHLKDSMAGPRILTIFVYLNDMQDQESGGETHFEHHNITVTPKVGRVALWSSVLNENPQDWDNRTQHQAKPVLKGQKFGANSWFRLRSVEKATQKGCMM